MRPVFKTFTPPPLPVDIPFDAELQRALSIADRTLGEFLGLIDILPNADLLLAPIIRREAVMSAQIEGSQATMSDVLLYEAGMDVPHPQLRDDRREIINYRHALNEAESKLQSGEVFDMPMLCRIHQVLLGNSARGNDKSPGALRQRQNLIGPPEALTNPDKAIYIPPPPQQVGALMDNWLEHWRGNDNAPLVQAAILHGQFEMIHPFEDGNGRAGRLLIPLFLYATGAISRPVFYLSGQLAAWRDAYCDGLRALSERGDWRGWLLFFLTACANQASNDKAIAKEIMALREDMIQEAAAVKSRYAAEFINAIFTRPIFTLPSLRFANPPSGLTLRRLASALVRRGIIQLRHHGVRNRPTIYAFPRLLEICEK